MVSQYRERKVFIDSLCFLTKFFLNLIRVESYTLVFSCLFLPLPCDDVGFKYETETFFFPVPHLQTIIMYLFYCFNCLANLRHAIFYHCKSS